MSSYLPANHYRTPGSRPDNPYRTLGDLRGKLPRNATPAAIVARRDELLVSIHYSMSQATSQASYNSDVAWAVRVNEAADILLDPHRRASLDAYLPVAANPYPVYQPSGLKGLKGLFIALLAVVIAIAMFPFILTWGALFVVIVVIALLLFGRTAVFRVLAFLAGGLRELPGWIAALWARRDPRPSSPSASTERRPR